MEDIIDSSPPNPSSQRKRRHITKCHASQKKNKRDVCNIENVFDLTKDDSLTRSDILKRYHLQEQASSQKVHTVKLCNANRSESRMSNRAGFLSASQYAIRASQSSSALKFGENCQLKSGIVVTSNCNTFLETQGFTDSQLQIIDNDTKLRSIGNNDSKSMSTEATKISQKDNVVLNDSVQLGVTVEPEINNTVIESTSREVSQQDNVVSIASSDPVQLAVIALPDVNNRVIENTSEDAVNTSQHSLKRQKSLVESILNEWPTSPEKKTSQLTPQFIFDKRLVIRTYLAKRNSPATTSSPHEDGNSPKEIGQDEIVPANVTDEEVDLNKSVKIIDNIQNLVEFYSQSLSETSINEINETYKAVMDLKSQSSTKPSQSLVDEEDLLGFDTRKFVTLDETFHDFLSHSSDEVSIINQHHDMLMEDVDQHHDMLADDDDIFLHFKTQRNLPVESNWRNQLFYDSTQVNMSAVKDDVLHGNLPTASRYNEANARSVDLGEANNIFDDIENEYGLAQPNNPFWPPSATSLMQNIPNMTTPTYPSFTSFGKSHLAVLSASSSKKTNLFDSIEVTYGDERKMNNRMDDPKIQNVEVNDDDLWNMIDDSDQEWDIKIDRLSEIPATVSKESTSNVMPVRTYAGFSTATGKQFPVSSAMISKKTNFFQNYDDLRQMDNLIELDNDEKCNIKIDQLSESPATVSKESTSNVMPVFSTAAGKQIPVSSSLITKKTNIFQNDDDLRDRDSWIELDNEEKCAKSSATVSKESTSNVMPVPTFASFSTAGGKQISVSAAMISKKTNIFQNDDDLRDRDSWIELDNEEKCAKSSATVSKESTSNVMPVPTFASFSTAGGKQISVSAAMVSKKTNIFQNDDDLRDRDIWIELDNEEKCEKSSATVSKESTSNVMPVPTFAGFSTAGGKQISVSPAMISKKTNLFQNVEVTVDDLRKMDNWTDNNELDTDNRVNSLSKSTETVSEKNMTIFKPNGSHTVASATNFQDINQDYVRSTGQHQNSLRNAQSNNFPDVTKFKKNGTFAASNVDFSTVRGGLTSTSAKMKFPNILFDEKSNQSNSPEFFREVTNSLHPPQRETNMVPRRNMLIGKSDKSPINTFIKPSPLRKFSMVNSLRKLEVESSKENVDIQPTSLIQTPTSSKGYVCVTPTNNPKTLTQECRESAELCLLDDELSPVERDNSSPGFMAQINAQTIISSTPIRKIDSSLSRPKQTRLVERFDDLAGEDYFQPNIQSEPKIQITFDIISLRREAFEVQRRSIDEKTNVKPVPGTLYVNKLTAHKVEWKEFVDNSRPTTIKNVLPTSAPKLANNVLHVTTENATKFKFNAWVHYSDEFCRENVDGIHLRDDIVVMMDENCQIGLKEISNAFLSCPSVDPKLIHDKWIENSMKWIVIKLAGMERSFPHRFAGNVLTIENLLLQMKFRYDREIDHVERSAIRKICEMDDIAAKRMILFVARLTTNGYQCQVELCDGWYSLLSTLDYEMRKLVDKGKIKVGTKLVIHGAEIEHLENGCHPLDIPSNVRLKIYVNSTRRARWDSKLGYCKNPGPFKISLRSVQPAGGRLTKLSICVLRVYPVTYVCKSSSGMEIHSEKVEMRRSIKEERDRSIIIDKIFNQVCKDFEDEQKAARYENTPRKMPKLSDISTITDPAELYHLLEDDNDPDRIVNEMTHSQRTMVQNYREKLSCSRSEEINSRVREKLSCIDKNKAKFSPVLNFRIADGMSFDKTAIVTIWKPKDDDFAMIQERSIYEMSSAQTKGFVRGSNDMQIYAGKDTIFKRLSADQVPSLYCRRCTSISEIISMDNPVLNELDTVGFVVHVGDATTEMQPVYIADDDRNIVAIYFWVNLKKYAYDDVVQPNRFLAIKNLHWRSDSNGKPIPCTYASQYSTFTENPTSSEFISAMTSLKMKFESVKMEEFYDACMEKIRSHKPPFQLTPARTSSMQSSLSTTPTNVSHSTLSNQNRMDLLSKYGDATTLPPIHINSLNKSFMLPVFEHG